MRRGQFQTLEPIFVVMILVILSVVAFVIYYNASQTQRVEDERQFDRQDDLAVHTRVMRMPELSCSKEISDANCIDLYKARAFAVHAAEDEAHVFYGPVLGQTKIILEVVEVGSGDPETIELYMNLFDENKVVSRTYFSVYDPATKTTRFATMVVERPP